MKFFVLCVAFSVSSGLVVAQAPAAQPQGATGPSSFTVKGDVTTPLTLKAEDLAGMPREKVTIPDADGAQVEYEGVPLREILKKAGAPVRRVVRDHPWPRHGRRRRARRGTPGPDSPPGRPPRVLVKVRGNGSTRSRSVYC